LYHNEELSYEEIGTITGLPAGTVKSYLFRARRELKMIFYFIIKRRIYGHKTFNDDEVQQYVVDKATLRSKIVEHIHSCEVCSAKVEVYQLMIKGIKQHPQPAFDFDLSKMVLQQLPSPPSKVSNDKLLVWLFVSTGIVFIGGGLYFFQSYFELFEGLRTIFIYLIAITAVTVLVYLFIDMYKKYRHGMKVLDLY
jgi:hypothetical protein